MKIFHLIILKKINYNRFQVICYIEQAFFKYINKHHPARADQFETIFEVSSMRSGFGFSKKIPESLVQQFQTALDDLKATQTIENILKKYKMQ